MKANTKIFILSILVIILLFIFLSSPDKKGCFKSSSETKPDTTTVIDTTIFIDTIPYFDTIPVKPAIKNKIVYVKVPADIDSSKIAIKYFAHVFRDDTLKNDTNIFIRLQQEITKNDVINQILEVHDFKKTHVITKEKTITVTGRLPKLYIGTFVLNNTELQNTVIGAKFMYKTKNNIFISGGYGFPKTIYFDAAIPINKLFKKH